MFRRRSRPKDLSFLRADVHAHLLPGIDDGPRTMEEALLLIEGLMELGYEKLVTTPHIMEAQYGNTAPGILERLAEVRTAISEKGWRIELHAAAEYMIDSQFYALLEAGELLPVYDRYILVEFPRLSKPVGLQNLFFRMQVKGYFPVLAHPERYLFFDNDNTGLEKIRDMGVLFQVNLLSLAGYYGSAVRRRAKELMSRKWADLLGTDLHNERQLHMLQQLAGDRQICKAIMKQPFKNLEI